MNEVKKYPFKFSIFVSRRKVDVNSGSSYGSVISGLSKAPTSAKKKKLATPKPMSKSLSQPQVSTFNCVV